MSKLAPTKRQLRAVLELDNDSELARFFEISPSAVNQWPEDAPINKGRVADLLERRPDLWGVDWNARAAAAHAQAAGAR